MRRIGKSSPMIRGSLGEFFKKVPPFKGIWSLSNDARDWTGNALHGTVTGAIQAPGKFERCYYFDGDDYVTVTDNAKLDFGTGNFSIVTWIKYAASHTGFLVSKGDADGSTIPYYALYVRTSDPYVQFFLRGVGTSVTTSITSQPIPFFDDKWHCIVAVRNGTAIALYADGRIIGSATAGSLLDVATTGNDLYFATRINAAAKELYYTGNMEKVAIIGKALSAGEVSQYYQWATILPKEYYFYNFIDTLTGIGQAAIEFDQDGQGIVGGIAEGSFEIEISTDGESTGQSVATGTATFELESTGSGFTGNIAVGEVSIELRAVGVTGVKFTTELEFEQSGTAMAGLVGSGDIATIEIHTEGICFATGTGTGGNVIEIETNGAGSYTITGTGNTVLNIVTDGTAIGGSLAIGETTIEIRASGDGLLSPLTITGIGEAEIEISGGGTAVAGLASSGSIAIEFSIDASGLSGAVGSGTVALQFTAQGLAQRILVATDYVCVVINTETGAVSEYDNYDFNSFAEFNGTYIGARADGIYELEGTDDDGTDIDAYVKWGYIDPNLPTLSRFEHGFLIGEATGSIKVTTSNDSQESVDILHEIFNYDEHRVKIGQGLKGRLYEKKVENLNGCYFKFYSYRALARELRRRR